MRQGLRGRAQRRDVVGVARRRLHLFWAQCRPDRRSDLADEPELLRLIIRDEIRHGAGLRDFRQFGEALCGGFGRGKIRLDHFDRISAGLRIVAQLEICRDRFRLWILQMQRVEVEGQKGEQRRGEDYDRQCPGDHRHAAAL